MSGAGGLGVKKKAALKTVFEHVKSVMFFVNITLGMKALSRGKKLLSFPLGFFGFFPPVPSLGALL